MKFLVLKEDSIIINQGDISSVKIEEGIITVYFKNDNVFKSLHKYDFDYILNSLVKEEKLEKIKKTKTSELF